MDVELPPNLFVNSIGALFIGNSFSLLFLGAILILCWAYHWIVKYYGAPAMMANLPAYYSIYVLAVSICTSINQMFYSYRIQVISQACWISGVILFFSTYQFIYVIWMAQLLLKHPYTTELNTKIMPSGYSWMASCAAADFIITASMFWFLVIKTNISRQDVALPSQSIFKRIAFRTLQFNVWSLAFQISEIIIGTASVSGDTLWFVVPSSTISKVYTAAVLVSLISRGGKEENSHSIGLSDVSGSSARRSKRTGSSGITVTIDQHPEEAKSQVGGDHGTLVAVSFDTPMVPGKQEQV